jgi:hypothetical protein
LTGALPVDVDVRGASTRLPARSPPTRWATRWGVGPRTPLHGCDRAGGTGTAAIGAHRPGVPSEHGIGRPVTRGRYYQQVSDHVDDARDYLARRAAELVDRRTVLAARAARIRTREPLAAADVAAAEQAAADGLAHAVVAHRRAAAQHERTAIAHDRYADLLDAHHAPDQALGHRHAATVERAAAQRSRVEADRAEREGTSSNS